MAVTLIILILVSCLLLPSQALHKKHYFNSSHDVAHVTGEKRLLTPATYLPGQKRLLTASLVIAGASFASNFLLKTLSKASEASASVNLINYSTKELIFEGCTRKEDGGQGFITVLPTSLEPDQDTVMEVNEKSTFEDIRIGCSYKVGGSKKKILFLVSVNVPVFDIRSPNTLTVAMCTDDKTCSKFLFEDTKKKKRPSIDNLYKGVTGVGLARSEFSKKDDFDFAPLFICDYGMGICVSGVMGNGRKSLVTIKFKDGTDNSNFASDVNKVKGAMGQNQPQG